MIYVAFVLIIIQFGLLFWLIIKHDQFVNGSIEVLRRLEARLAFHDGEITIDERNDLLRKLGPGAGSLKSIR